MNWVLVPLEVLWLLPVWIWCALSCRSIAGCKNLSGGDWFFRGMVFQALAAGGLLAIKSAEAEGKEADPFADPVARDIALWLLVLLSIPILSGLAVITAACIVGDASFLNIYAAAEMIMWLPLVWITSIIAAGRIARYKGADARSWAIASAVGFVVPVALLLNLRSEEGSEAQKNKFLEDPRAKKIVNTLMIGLLVPFALGIIAVVILLVGLCVWRGLMSLHWMPVTPMPSLQVAPVVFVAVISAPILSSWLLSGLTSCLMASRRDRNVVLWTVLGFIFAGLAPLVLFCFKRASQSQSSGDVNSIEHSLDKWVVSFALFPCTALCFWFFTSDAAKQLNLIQPGSDVWQIFSSAIFACWTFSQLVFFVLVPLILWFMMRAAKAAGTNFRLFSFADAKESLRSLAFITIGSVEFMQLYLFVWLMRHAN